MKVFSNRGMVLLVTLVFALGVVAVACAPEEVEPDEPVDPEEPEPEPEDVQEIVLAITRDPETLDPAHLSWTSAHGVANNIYNGLVRWKTGTFEIIPDLAHDWEISEDGTTYTFFLREGVQWHDDYGEFTADDVKFTFERILDEDTGSRWKTLIDILEEIEVVDDYTVKLHTSSPSPVFLHNISNYRPGKIMCRAAYEEMGEDHYAFHPIGTGPFEFDRWTPHEEVILVANDDYFEGAPDLRKATFRVIPEDTVAQMSMEAGEIDTMLVSLEEVYDAFQANPDIVLQDMPSTATRYLNLKTVMEPLDDVQVRRALAHATNQEQIAEMMGMGALPMRAMIPEGMFGYSEDVPYYEFDPDRARELLAEAGYPDGFELQAFHREPEHIRDMFTLIQSQWAEVDVDLELRTMDSTAWIEATTAGEAPVAQMSLSARYDPDAILSGFFHGSVSSPHGRNFTWYGGADDLLDAARVEMDEERREELYFDVQMKFYEDVPTIPLYQPQNVRALQPWVKGFTLGQVEDSYLYPVYIEGRGQ